jgi:sigma-B regulation protein RsbU (phosphoserine phosphatase)
MTAWSSVPVAVAMLQRGVGDFVEKPWDNARLLAVASVQVEEGRARRREQKLRHDAREVQARLLALGAPAVEGYDVGVAWSFAEELGGDAHEVVSLPEGRLMVAIADVCGKGLPAALLMSSLDATLRETAAADLGPRDACRRIAAHMRPRLGPDRFVSAVYMVLDRRRGRVTYVNAGHPPPILLRADAQTRRLARGGPVLGAPGEADYEEGVLALRTGDRLVLFTDGVLEAAGSEGPEFGDERVLLEAEGSRARSASAAAAALLERARAHAAGPLADDATALVVSVAPDAGGGPALVNGGGLDSSRIPAHQAMP